ncbi:amino acid adenylation domain-containing protein [Pseudoalteromonas sp. SMS1]|uniref:non-ribosomal peptide synthetase n=1 Tax=Pseudoalteromonas sp. SMS1 TaxID=2908894 RepID=UPI001F1EBC3E|nr:non-ribosomal peptide synthetase [Pseudoalteromonas sp. SMS1]MCF2860137.1 amino acid adenylation domain-containing protein [Pseudoalteromonas sp. SMS1]
MKETQDTMVPEQTNAQQDIAIVGISLRFPGANSKEQFWHNLANKVSSIREIPESRWRWQDDFDPAPKKDEQKIVSKWGGFIDNIDSFDAHFFAISPKEAQSMDPQQRLSMELAWQCFEDAGLSPSSFKNTKTGVYLGCSNTDYQELATGNIDPHFLTGMSTGVFANRISHFFNFQGPSETVDTACSSSLVALHKAVNDFKAGEINAALVGGVNLLITKSRYVSFSKLGVLSPQGRCKTLDADADGYVRGEGVGMVLLLPLKRAQAENLNIYGVIKGSSVGHSGHTNTLTSPSPFSQSRVIQAAIDNAGIHSNDLSFIELHGTGTVLGDPIEIQGLKRAFRATKSKQERNEQQCYLSTVKTNIGHLESAAGIAGIIKVLLSFKHQQRPPLQNFETLNPKIALEKSPFVLTTECQPWQQSNDKPLLAGISSFGFAGVNAHVILQSPPKSCSTQATKVSPVAIVLSAKKSSALTERAKQLHAFIKARALDDTKLVNLAYTLQVGRDHMQHRLCFIADSIAEVVHQLDLFIGNQHGTWQQSKINKENTQSLDASNCKEALAHWMTGAQINWRTLYPNTLPLRIALPGYPFNSKPYWMNGANHHAVAAQLHPLLHQSLPAFDALLFSASFNGNEFFLNDHQIQHERILPGVCGLEMVRAAISLSHNLGDHHSLTIENINWLRPICIKPNEDLDHQRVFLSMWEVDTQIQFEIRQQQGDDEQICASGTVLIGDRLPSVTALDLPSTPHSTLTSSQVYSLFQNAGIEYGPSFQGLKQVELHDNIAIAKVQVPPTTCEDFALSPALMDAALQSLIIFNPKQLALPFATDKVTYFNANKLAASYHEEVLVKAVKTSADSQNTQKFDIDICDLEGQLLVRIQGFSTREVTAPALPKTDDVQEKLLTLKPCWTEVTPTVSGEPASNLRWQYIGPSESKPHWLAERDSHTEFDHLLWVAQGDYAAPLKLFNYLKELLAQGYDTKTLSITLITNHTHSVFGEPVKADGAGLIGLLQSVTQEYSRWTLRVIDINGSIDNTDLSSHIAELKAGCYALRHTLWYRFELTSHDYLYASTGHYKPQGVYVVLGGAGGLGQVWSQWMIERFDAHIIWLGRRPIDSDIEASIARLAKRGKAPVYISCDARDRTAMQAVCDDIKRQYGAPNGVVHSILHLEDQTFAKMDETQFLRSYEAKQLTGEVALDVFGHVDLDFFLFFSSMQSFSPAPGQNNYAAGCTYLDSLARSYQHICPVKVINWGYWGSVGVVQDEYYQKKMQAIGLGSIEAEAGMAALDKFIGSDLLQAGVMQIIQGQFQDTLNQLSYSAAGEQPNLDLTQSQLRLPEDQAAVDTDLEWLCSTLIKAGWQTPQSRQNALDKLPSYFKKWWTETQRYLADHGLLTDGVLKAVEYEGNTDGQTNGNLLSNCLANLPAILSNEMKATDAVFPNASLALVEAVYQNNPTADYANHVLIEQLQAYLTQHSLSSIKVLEIGAGTGGTTRSVLPALDKWQVDEYAYTDLSHAFFNHAKAQYQTKFPFVEPKYLDISKPIGSQNIELGGYDVVIATNVLHATADIKHTLQNAKACLKSGGLLLVNEVVKKSLFTHLTFGLLEGWWLSQDAHLRLCGSPMLSASSWQKALAHSGFTPVTTPADVRCSQQIFCAISDGQILQKREPMCAHTIQKKPKPKHMTNKKVSLEHPQSHALQNTTNVCDQQTITLFVQEALFNIASHALDIAPNELDIDESFADYGVDSILAIQILDEINAKFTLNLPATLLFDYPSVETLSHYIAQEHTERVIALMPAQPASPLTLSPQPEQPVKKHCATKPSLKKHYARTPKASPASTNNTQNPSGKIAIVGMSGQFGDAHNLDEFWSMLCEKRTSVKAQTRWHTDTLNSEEKAWSQYASLLDDISTFDAPFFSITPQEAMYMDPQQRLFLQEAYKALEDANMITQVSGQNVGVYLGCAQSDYAEMAERDAPAQVFWGNAGSVIPARVSYFLNLKGPALAIDTACSSSLVAIHSACQALNNDEISSALVGGVATLCSPKFSIYAGRAGMLSPDGTCYTFDDRANGFVPGEGVGVLVLKKLEDAERDNDQIYGVILGSATNQDGTTSGITAPSSLSQEQLHQEIYDRFNIEPDSIQMLEAHGTGTKLGDPIEFQALTRAFRAHTKRTEFCALGSVKTNIGHCLTAAGVAGVIKALLAIKYRTIPASLHFEQGNSHIDWQNSPFFVNQDAHPWQPKSTQKRRAAVSSFGFSGTNAHVVLEEYEATSPAHFGSTEQPVIISLSAKSKASLIEKAQQLYAYLDHDGLTDTQLSALAYTLQSAREEMEHRLAFSARTIKTVRTQLSDFLASARGDYKQGEVKQGKEILSALDSSDFTRWIEQGELNKLLALWVVGANIDWPLLYGESLPRRLRLPTYPFAKGQFWLPNASVVSPQYDSAPTQRLDQDLSFDLQGDEVIELTPTQPSTASVKAKSTLLHYTANWIDTPLATHDNAIQNRHIVLIGENLACPLSTPITHFTCDNTSVDTQLETYTNKLITFFKTLDSRITATGQKRLVQVVVQDQSHLLSALNGVLKSAAIEYSCVSAQLICITDNQDLEQRLNQESTQPQQCIRYTQGRREVLNFDLQPYSPVNATTLPWKEQGIYVITGGLGQLGQIFAKEIIRNTTQSHVVLIGRSPLNSQIQSQLNALQITDTQLSYESVDMTDSIAVTQLFNQLHAQHGSITGIIHSAGVIKDQLISDKTPQEVAAVFAPKVTGLINLDEATKSMDLDFFACFSSIAAIFGNMGQADYACANAFMDRFMTNRKAQVVQGERFGLSLSINWPLWSEGGMQVDSLTASILHSQGIEGLPNEVGIDAFYRIFTAQNIAVQHCFLFGDAGKLSKLWHWHPSENKLREHTHSGKSKTVAQISTYVKSVVSNITKIDSTDLEDDTDFKDMGFDSIMLMSIVQKIESDGFLEIDALPPTLLFDISTIAQLCDYLLKHQTPEQPTSVAQHTPICSTSPIPLSKAQQGLWLLQKQNPTLSSYHVPMVFEVTNLNVACMQDALDWVSKKHPILSVVISEIEGLPQQVITHLAPNLTPQYAQATTKSALLALIKEDIKRPFLISQNTTSVESNQLLWRATHWRIDHSSQPLDVIVLVFHHLIIDGVSATRLLEELWQAYQTRLSNNELLAPGQDLGFFAYLEWEKQMLNSAQSKVLKQYWQSNLHGPLPILTLPEKRQVSSTEKLASRIELPLPGNGLARIEAYCSTHKINPAAFFLAAFQTLLSAKTRCTDILVGIPVLHRPTKEMTDSLGLFVNQLPYRAHLNWHQTFDELALNNQRGLGQLIKHSALPFSEIVRTVQAPRAKHDHPIFQIGFAYHNFLKAEWIESNQDLVNSIWQSCLQEPELDLSLEITPLPNTFKIAFKFNAYVYPVHAVNALAEEFLTLLEDVMFANKPTLNELPIFASHSPAVQPKNLPHTLVSQFETQVRHHPLRTAVSIGMQSLSYSKLNDKANQFAQALLSHPEFKPNSQNLIALCAKPSADLIVAILGILKSGAAYVPIDPSSPKPRISHILQDAQPCILVLDTDLPETGSITHHQVIDLQHALSGNTQVTNINRAKANGLAYMIYTSGSTGKPKGVLVEHSNICSLISNTQPLFGFNEQDVWCLFHSYAFDFSVWEIWGALLNGGKLTIPDEIVRKDTGLFAQFIADNQVTILNQTPSAFYPLMAVLVANGPDNNALRKVIFGGEALDLKRLMPWFSQPAAHAELINMYGITETTVHVTHITIDADLVHSNTAQSVIGRPLPGYEIHLFDEHLNPVQPGQTGEIYVGGCGVSRGYHNQIALTNTRFIQHVGQRLYRSGDLARLNHAGVFEYIGRVDDQVQIRGHRIELGEVQHALHSLEYIQDAYVTAAKKQLGQVLVAFLVASDAPSTAQIRTDLLIKLPEYMVPAYFVFVPNYPLTANGKVDKQALLAQLPFSQQAHESITSPATHTATLVHTQPTFIDTDRHAAITQIWQEVLEVDQIATNVPFFEAGGDSLLANVLSAKFKSQLGIEFPITHIFQHSTIDAMASYVAQQHTNIATPSQQDSSPQLEATQSDDSTQSVAMIGLSCQYPNSPTHQAFWQNLVQEKDFLTRLSESKAQGDITWLDSWVDGQELFDPEFFNISEKNAKTMSYSQRQLLLHAWKAIEDAGYRTDQMPNTGVYVSSSGADTLDLHLQDKFKDGQFVLNAQDYVASTINQPGTLPTTISYHLGFNGPSLFVHSNCSSSLSAVALACSALKAKEIDYAIVGAACLYPQRYTGYEHEQGLNFAADARCKVFDEKADGMIGGSGVSVIVLKRAEEAIADADNIYSLIRGVKVNNDGKDKAGFFAPGTQGQMHVIEQTLASANVSPASISYVEAHGTGTELGDPVEFTSLQQIYQKHTNNKQFCGLGAVKSNLGHTDTLAGLTGLIKTSLALYNKKLPASLHYNKANPHIDLANSPFYVVDKTQDWHTPLLPRRAAVSSFGIGGTNAHAILEEKPQDTVPSLVEEALVTSPSIVVLSAQNPHVLANQVKQLHAFIIDNPLSEYERIRLAYTLQFGRSVMHTRTGFVVNSVEELKSKLEHFLLSPNYNTAPQKAAHQGTLSAMLAQDNHTAILNTWLETGFNDWGFIYQGRRVQKLCLPTYPFALKAMPMGEGHAAKVPSSKTHPVDSAGRATIKIPVWTAKPIHEQELKSQEEGYHHHVVLCEAPEVEHCSETLHTLRSNHFSIEQKIEDYGFQLIELAKCLHATKQPIKLQLLIGNSADSATLTNLYTCFHALLKTVSLECNNLKTQLLIIDIPSSPRDIAHTLNENLTSFEDSVVRYQHTMRSVLAYSAVADQPTPSPFKPNGIYLITGGFGGIGRHFIQSLNAQPFHKTVIVTGRKPLDHPEVTAHLAQLQGTHSDLHYHQLDVSHKMDVLLLIRKIVAEHGTLSGVVHSAGIVEDTRFTTKDRETFKRVLSPKVAGVVALDEATQDIALDFFTCFAGLSGVHGALTQVDYATANAFLDSYMHQRDALQKQGKRHGLSASIDWPYWQDGGMTINPDVLKAISSSGFAPMPTQVGINAFSQALHYPQALVEYSTDNQQQKGPNTLASKQFKSREALTAALEESLAQIAANVLGVATNEIDPDTDLGDFGADSIAFITFINQINTQYELTLSPSVLFMHSTLNGILQHIVDEHGAQLIGHPASHMQPCNTPQNDQSAPPDDRIAIVGMSAQFPKAHDLATFWQNLINEQDCISEFNWVDAPGNDPRSQKTLPNEINWLGRLERNQTFDPLFFNIAPAESERIKLQESLLMTHVWKCIEDAGYDPKSLAGTNTGLFIGCQASYHDGLVTSCAYAPNRMSYFLDLHGPSEGVDTTCSSSLVAIHKAIQSIRSGECDQAIVGGVNVIDSPSASLAMHEIGALSATGRCRTFSSDADGIVRGEGVGMLFIKKLSNAEQDNDHIYGTVLGSAINHGGKSQGFTVPNAKAQTRLLNKAWTDAGIDPSTLSYIECHGTGTSLGDPVEIDALKAAFKPTQSDQTASARCALGSVKSNIGHLEIAAGIAGVIKVLLQLKQKTLVPSLHVTEQNPYLSLENSPFEVQVDTRHWESIHPRRAGVSSFGISGVNAHLVLEEYTPPAQQTLQEDNNSREHIVVLSATSISALTTKVRELKAYLDEHDEPALDALAYTLQIGRTAHKYRIGWTVSSIATLKSALADALNDNLEASSKVPSSKQPTLDDTEIQQLQHDLQPLLRFWLAGHGVNWQVLYITKPRRLNLPSTSFIEHAPVVKSESAPWLLLNNQWQAQPLNAPNDWHSHIESTAGDKKILVISKHPEAATALSNHLKKVEIETLSFLQMTTHTFNPESLPDVIFFIGEAGKLASIDPSLQPLHKLLMAIAPFDKHPIQLFYSLSLTDKHARRDDISALLRSYTMRNAAHAWALIEFDNQVEDWAELLVKELISPSLSNELAQPNHVKYLGQTRYGQFLQQAEQVQSSATEFKEKGTYLVVGALGELGLGLCAHLLQNFNATIVLLGRRQIQACEAPLKTLKSIGKGHIHYLTADVTSTQDLNDVKQYLADAHLTLNGVLHLGTSFSEHESTWEDFEEAIRVKVQGSINLDNLFADTNLDMFVMFSSMAVFGSLNHLSYSYGNGFQNAFSTQRQQWVEQGTRQGKTLAINWGYWQSNDPVKRIENRFAEKKGYQLIKMAGAVNLIDSLLRSQYSTIGALLSSAPNKIYQNTAKLMTRNLNNMIIAEPIATVSEHIQTPSDLRGTVIQIVSQVIGIPSQDLDLDCDLYEYGFDSISLLKTFQQLKDKLAIDLQADTFKNMNTIGAFVEDIEALYQAQRNGKEHLDKQQKPDFILDAGFTPKTNTDTLEEVFNGDVESVLLTGATGFLGSHILQQLLNETQAIIYCVVRAKSLKQAKQRIKKSAQDYQLNIDMARVRPMLGDMEQPQLGLSDADWQVLCEQVQHIVHTASYVNHIQPYFAFKKSVAGTNQLLDIATTHTLKMVHFVSSTTASTQVKNSHFSVNPVEDFINIEDAELICSGYGQSKWVQEENIRQASEVGVPYTIYRFAQISGSSETGVGNTDDIFHRILKMMMKISSMPRDASYLLDIIPVDKAAMAIVKGMAEKEKRNTVYHVANAEPLPIAHFYQFAQSRLLSFEPSSKSDFIDACKVYVDNLEKGNNQVIMEGLLTQRPGYDEYLFETYLMPMTPYNKENYLALMHRYNIEPTNWEALFETYFHQWQKDKHYQIIWQSPKVTTP